MIIFLDCEQWLPLLLFIIPIHEYFQSRQILYINQYIGPIIWQTLHIEMAIAENYDSYHKIGVNSSIFSVC